MSVWDGVSCFQVELCYKSKKNWFLTDNPCVLDRRPCSKHDSTLPVPVSASTYVIVQSLIALPKHEVSLSITVSVNLFFPPGTVFFLRLPVDVVISFAVVLFSRRSSCPASLRCGSRNLLWWQQHWHADRHRHSWQSQPGRHCCTIADKCDISEAPFFRALPIPPLPPISNWNFCGNIPQVVLVLLLTNFCVWRRNGKN